MNPLEKELVILLEWLCREWGFCIPPDDRFRIARSSRLEAGEFAIDVLRAEGFEQPEHESQWIRRIKARFVEHFGRSLVSVDDYEG